MRLLDPHTTGDHPSSSLLARLAPASLHVASGLCAPLCPPKSNAVRPKIASTLAPFHLFYIKQHRYRGFSLLPKRAADSRSGRASWPHLRLLFVPINPLLLLLGCRQDPFRLLPKPKRLGPSGHNLPLAPAHLAVMKVHNKFAGRRRRSLISPTTNNTAAVRRVFGGGRIL